jgi:hypothetical protein
MTKNTSFNRRYSVKNSSAHVGGNFNYLGFKRLILGRYNLFGTDIHFSQFWNYTRKLDNSRVSDYDSTGKQYIINGNLTNVNKKELFEYTPSLSFSKIFYSSSGTASRSLNAEIKLMEEIKNDKNTSTFVKRNLNRSFQFFRYEAYIYFSYQKREKYRYFASINYTKNLEYPSIDLLYTIVDDINQYDIRIGNPGLRNTVNHLVYFNLSYNSENSKSLYTINGDFDARYNYSVNPISDSILNDYSGKRMYYYINADRRNSINLSCNFNIARRIGKSNFQLNYRGQFRTEKLPNYIDSRYNSSETENITNQLKFQFSLRSLLIVNLDQTLQRYKSEQTADGLSSFRNSNSLTRLGVVINCTPSLSFSSSFENIDNSNLNKSIGLWNAFSTYRFMKQQCELKFSAMDILKQYRNISNYVSPVGTTTTITNGLQRYFLLTLSYYPRKFGKAEIKNIED